MFLASVGDMEVLLNVGFAALAVYYDVTGRAKYER